MGPRAWAVATILWIGNQALGGLLRRFQRAGNLAASGVVAFGMMFRAIVVGMVSLRGRCGRRGARVDGCASLRARVHGRARAVAGRSISGGTVRRLTRVLVVARDARARRARGALAKGEFHPRTEFEQHEWISIHLGPLDLSITKAVVYLMLGAVLHDPARARADARSRATAGRRRRSASWSTRSRRRRSRSRACRRRRSAAGSRTSPR